MTTWNAWDDADRRRRLVVRVCPLPADTGGGVHATFAEGHVVLLDEELEGPVRHDTLAHELVHIERGPVPGGRLPHRLRHLVVREERRCWEVVAERLVPPAMLASWCDQQADLGHGVGPDEVADEFDVSWAVAAVALEVLADVERGR